MHVCVLAHNGKKSSLYYYSGLLATSASKNLSRGFYLLAFVLLGQLNSRHCLHMKGLVLVFDLAVSIPIVKNASVY